MAQRTAVVASPRHRPGRGWVVAQAASARRLQVELRRLADLRDQQLLTEEEFLVAKGKLLDAS
jgi:hypothetical protein